MREGSNNDDIISFLQQEEVPSLGVNSNKYPSICSGKQDREGITQKWVLVKARV